MLYDSLKKTPFETIYDSFFGRITSSMYMEITEEETYSMLETLLMNGLCRFEFPRFNVFDYEQTEFNVDLGTYCGAESGNVEVPAIGTIGGKFNSWLTIEEINILAMCMVIEWLNQQLETTENTKMQYTGSDFKMTSQANHMAKLKVLINDKERDCLYLQRLYKRRKVAEDGSIRSTISDIVSKPSYGVEPADCNNLSFLSFVNQR